MPTLRLARTELRRLTSGKLPKLALVAVTLVPLLYGALYIYANWNPYDRLESVPAAVVIEDTGATRDDGSRLRAGETVHQRLVGSDAFDWHRVSQQAATSGVSEGRYTFALVVPEDFSGALTSPGEFDPRQARLRLITNDTNNYLVGTIADRVAAQVRHAVAADAGSAAADKLLLGLSTVHDKTLRAADGANKLAGGAHDLDAGIDDARAGARQLSAGADRLLDGQRQLADGAARVADGSAQVAEGNEKLHQGLRRLRDRTAPLPEKTEKLADGAERVAEGNEKLAAKAELLGGLSQDVVNKLDRAQGDIADRLRILGLPESEIDRITASLEKVDQPVDRTNARIQQEVNKFRALSDGANKVAAGARRLANEAPKLTGGIDTLTTKSGELADGAAKVRDGAARLSNKQRDAVTGAARLAQGSERLAGGTKQLAGGSDELASGSDKLADKLGNGAHEIPNPNESTRKETAETIGDPVAVDNRAQVSAATYGEGLAPYFMGLALWIGGFVLFLLMRPLSNRALAAGVAPWRTALGGWLPAAVIGSIQAVLLYLVVVFGVGISPANPWLTLAFLLLTSLAFTAVVHALNAAFGPRGKFLALVFLVLQLATAGGTFPWQTIPDILHPLHRVLPLSYVVDGLRHLIYGGRLDSAAQAALVLACYLACGLLLSTVAALRGRTWTPARLRPELSL